MKTHRNKTAVIFICLFVSMTLLFSKDGSSSYREYAVKLGLISREIVDLTSELELKDINQFKDIASQPSQNAHFALIALQDENLSKQEKLIALLSLYKISDISEYCTLLNHILVMFENGKVSEGILVRSMFLGDDWNYLVVDNAKNKDVIDILLRIKSSKYITVKTSSVVKNILDGVYSHNMSPRAK